MKVCIFGVGAVGCHMAARLLSANADEFSLVARGTMLKDIREHGVTLRSNGKEEWHAKPKVITDDPSTLPPQDVVLVCIKAPAMSAAAAAIGRLLAPGGVAVFLCNGVPWWFRHGVPGAGGTLPLLDPEGALWREVKAERTLGCVVLSPNEIVAPGVVEHNGLHKLQIGEPDNTISPRLTAVVDMIKRSGMDVVASNDVRKDMWRKLCMNASGNTVTALTRNDLKQASVDDGLRKISCDIMRETLAVAAAMGSDLRREIDVEEASHRGRAGQRTSMMQDAVAGRPMECEALMGQTQAFARELGLATPATDIILPLLRGLNRSFRGK
jgi:2-dehydropantoate 2-reductase